MSSIPNTRLTGAITYSIDEQSLQLLPEAARPDFLQRIAAAAANWSQTQGISLTLAASGPGRVTVGIDNSPEARSGFGYVGGAPGDSSRRIMYFSNDWNMWAAESRDRLASHEIGHLFGLPDVSPDGCAGVESIMRELKSSLSGQIQLENGYGCTQPASNTTWCALKIPQPPRPNACDKELARQRNAVPTPTPTPTPTPGGGGGGGGGELQPGNRYCSGSYELTEWFYYDFHAEGWFFYETTSAYSVSCAFYTRPEGVGDDEKGLGLVDNLRAGASRWRVVEIDQPEWRQDLPLQAMVGQSRLIAVGEPIRNVSRRSQDGQTVTTNYDVRLIEVFKGNAVAGATIAVKIPGGWVTEDDGVILDARTRRVRKMENGKKYVMFLKGAGNPAAALMPIRGSQGLYELPLNGSRVRHLGRSFDLPPNDDGELVTVFLRQIRDLTRNQ